MLSGLANELAYGKGLASGPPLTMVPFGSQLRHPAAEPCFQCQHVGVQIVLTSEQRAASALAMPNKGPNPITHLVAL